jgi:4-amino-4-deoxy-L-arabinose transferase-like glycosyltransferase
VLDTDNSPQSLTRPELDSAGHGSPPASGAASTWWGRIVEAVLVLASPALSFFVLRLSVMSPVGLPDPSIHTAYVVDPRQIFSRYAQALTATARMREGARIGFVVPARICYELFGAVPGYVVFRYLLALIAVTPAYVLLKRLYGRPAGAAAIVLIMSCPVLVRAWGTDYPNSAAVSYVAGTLACLGLALIASRRRWWWVALAGGLAAMATWAFLTSAMVVAVAVVGYLAMQWSTTRRPPLVDLGLLAAGGVVTTLALAAGSYFLLGQLDFVQPTWHAYVYLSQPSQELEWHSRNWHWVTFDTYLLVPPAIIGIGVVALGQRWRNVSKVGVYLLAVTFVTAAAATYLQFFHGVQILEVHFWSSVLWPAAILTFAVAVGEVTKGLQGDWLTKWLAPVVLVAVPLLYEAHGSVPAFKWKPVGLGLAAVVVLVALLVRVAGDRLAGGLAMLASIAGVGLMAAGLLILTVAPPVSHPPIPKTVSDPPAEYSTTLGVSDTLAIDEYRVTAALPNFTGEPAYRGEQLLIWWPLSQFAEMIEPMGIYHAGYDSVPGTWGMLSPDGVRKIERRRPGQILLMSYTGWELRSCLDALGRFDARLVRRAVIAAGPVKLHVWLIDLDQFIRQHRRWG